jgi:hypothetical protein
MGRTRPLIALEERAAAAIVDVASAAITISHIPYAGPSCPSRDARSRISIMWRWSFELRIVGT